MVDIPVDIGLTAMAFIYQAFFFGGKLWTKWWGWVLEIASFVMFGVFIYLRFIR